MTFFKNMRAVDLFVFATVSRQQSGAHQDRSKSNMELGVSFEKNEQLRNLRGGPVYHQDENGSVEQKQDEIGEILWLLVVLIYRISTVHCISRYL